MKAIQENTRKFGPKSALVDEIAACIESSMCSRLKRVDVKDSELSAELEGDRLCDRYLTRADGDEGIRLDSITMKK